MSPRWAILCVLVLSCVVFITRDLLIVHAHSHTYDEDTFILRGESFWNRSLGSQVPNDPASGAGLIIAPAWAIERVVGEVSAERIDQIVCIWKGVLCAVLVTLCFSWTRELYCSSGASMASAMLLFEPTLAAHTPLITLDSVATLGIVAGALAAWRWVIHPTWRRLIAMTVLIAFALSIKHTAIMLPVLVGVLLVLKWIAFRKTDRWHGLAARVDALQEETRDKPAALWIQAIVGGLSFGLAMWAFTGFDISPPIFLASDGIPDRFRDWRIVEWLSQPLPGGQYLRSVLAAYKRTSVLPATGYLFGEAYPGGRWSYFPIVASYKIPLGFAAIYLATLASFLLRKPRWSEVGVIVPLVLWALFVMSSPINIGFRHFLPVMVFATILCGRILCDLPERFEGLSRGLAWACVLGGAAHGVSVHPDYLSYLNLPRQKVQLQINESNLDWGQSLPQIKNWIAAHVPPDMPVYVGHFGMLTPQQIEAATGPGSIALSPTSPVPTRGVLILPPAWEAGIYAPPGEAYARFRTQKPIATIGHAVNVYLLEEN